MSAAKHTPGPWLALARYSDGITVTDSGGFEHVKAETLAILLDYDTRLGIGHWADDPRACREISGEEQSANARLIAAAPELLLAAQLLIDSIEGGNVHPEEAIGAARAAIAKATGEQA